MVHWISFHGQVSFDEGERNGDTYFNNRGADIEFVDIGEKLVYHSSDEHLYIDDLQQIASTYAVVSKEKTGSTHKVEVKETIRIKSLTK